MEVLYLDLWFALNLLCDYLLCLLTARAAGLYLKRRRYLLAALLGALYACAACFPGFSFLANPGWKLCFGVLMGYIAFGAERSALRCILLFFAVSAAFGGALLALAPGGGPLRLPIRVLLFSFLLCYAAGLLLFRCQSLLRSRRTCSVTIMQQGREVSFHALIDTGNSLRDPLSGARVLVATPDALRGILRENTALFRDLDPIRLQELSAQMPVLGGRLRLLPYSAVGGGGLLPVFRPDRLLIDGSEREGVLVALSPYAGGNGFDAII